jgi:hypothetical protein
VNPGGEPERDDTGLPPVDIKIPDDARDLDRDVQAYRRELRALQRGERRGRWHRSLSKDGVALPLLACCLVLALITGTLLSVFTATSDQGLIGSPGSATSPSARSGALVPPMVQNQPLPNAEIAVEGYGGGTLPVSTFRNAMLVLVPAACGCAGTFRWLAGVASTADVPAYVIYTSATQKEVGQLFGALDGRLRAPAGGVRLAEETDGQNLLSPDSVPVGIQAGQLTAILVGSQPTATWVSDMSPSDNRALLVQVLTGKSA